MTTTPTKEPTDDCCNAFDVEINNLLHRMNLDRSDIASLPDGATISINITTHRQAADLIKRMQAAWNRHTPQADSPFFKIGQMLFDANNKEATKASEQPVASSDIWHKWLTEEYLVELPLEGVPSHIRELIIGATAMGWKAALNPAWNPNAPKRESVADKQADATLIEKITIYRGSLENPNDWPWEIFDKIKNIIRQHTPQADATVVSLEKCAMALQGNQRIKLGSDLQVIAKAVLDEAGVAYAN